MMAYAIPLKNIGNYVLDQITWVRHYHPDALDGGADPIIRHAEFSIPFATADQLPMIPNEIFIGDEAVPLEEARIRLQNLTRKVRVASADINAAPQQSRGKLVLRVVF